MQLPKIVSLNQLLLGYTRYMLCEGERWFVACNEICIPNAYPSLLYSKADMQKTDQKTLSLRSVLLQDPP